MRQGADRIGLPGGLGVGRRALVVASVLALAGSAWGQYAPQNATGRILERDLRVGGTGLTPRPDFAAEVRFRNSIITGNAPNGMSFRGSVGYTDPFDFRGSLPSDSLYSFRRDSLASGFGGVGVRGTESLQYQFSMATGTGVNPNRLTVSRFGGGTPSVPMSLTDTRRTTSPATTSPWSAESPVTAVGGLRSPSAYGASRSLSPVLLDQRQDELGQPAYTIASGLLGVRTWTPRGVPAPKEEELVKENPLAPARAVKSASGAAVRTMLDDLRERLDEQPPPAGEGAKPEAAPGGTGPIEGEASGEAPRSAWQSRIDSLRDALRPGLPTSADRRAAEEAGLVEPGRPLDRDTILAIRRAGEKPLAQLIPEVPKGRDPYAENILRGQQLLAEERYFDAEERFARALSIREGDVAAMVGRLNAQLGSGLLVSAATNLRSLAIEHPESMGLRLGWQLLPTPARQEELLRLMRANIGGIERIDYRVPEESSLLLAYLGFQRGEASTAREGIEAYEKLVAGKPGEAMARFLRGVWLGEAGAGPAPDGVPTPRKP